MTGLLAGLDVQLWIAAITQLLLVLLGAIVSLQEKWARRHTVLILICFALLGIGGLWATIAQSAKSARETTEASAKLGTALTNLGTSTTDIARMTSLNTQLQNKLLDSSGIIAQLARQNIADETGGDSSCYLSLSTVTTNGTMQPTLIQMGRNHVLNVSIRIVDLDETLSPNNLGRQFSTPFLGRGTALMLDNFPLGSGDYKRYNVFVMAANGYFQESVRLEKILGTNNTWKRATWVVASYYDGKKGVVLEDIKNFPKDVLESDPDWKNSLKLKRLHIRQ